MRGMAEPFCNRYMLLSSLERRVGGQGVVQFASIINTHEKVRLASLSPRPHAVKLIPATSLWHA